MSYISPGTPQTCGKVERFHQALKKYLRAQPPTATLEQLQHQLDEFLIYYNTIRTHRALHRHTPVEAFNARPKAFPSGYQIPPHYRVRHDKIDAAGVITIRYNSRLHHIGLSKHLRGTKGAENHHDVAPVDEQGRLVAKCRIGDDASGLTTLLELLAEHGDNASALLPVAIETSRRLLVASLRATGRPMYAINPLAASRYRERHTVARAKSDHVDAVVLANILRTDADAHRLLPSDSELVQAIAVLARGGQDAAWSRQQIMNQLRSILRECFPAAVCAFKDQRAGLSAAEARTILAAVPTPGAAARLTKARLRRLLVAAGRQRNIDARIDQLLTVSLADRCANCLASKPLSVNRPRRCSCNSTLSAGQSITSRKQPRRPSASIPTQGSSLAFRCGDADWRPDSGRNRR